MERAKRAGKPLRTAIPKLVNEVEQEIQAKAPDQDVLKDQLEKVEELQNSISQSDNQILDLLSHPDKPEENYLHEHAAVEDYQDKIRVCKRKINEILRSQHAVDIDRANLESGPSTGARSGLYKLPEIELRKFSGEMKDRLNCWSQFKRVHEDDELHPSDISVSHTSNN